MREPKIPSKVKAFIVQSLACYDTPSVVVAALKAEHGLVVSRQAIECYDPTKVAGKKLSAELTAIFTATREAFVDDISKIGIAHRSVRLRRLQRMVDRAEEQGNSYMVLQLLEQAAKEMGGYYSNRRELVGKDGKELPVPVSPVVIFQIPDNGRA